MPISSIAEIANPAAYLQKMTWHGSLDVGLACAKMMKTPLGALLNMLTLQTLVLLLLPEVVMPRPVDLPGAASDVVELERLATRLGPTRLLKLATRPTTDKGRTALLALKALALSGEHNPELAAQSVLPLSELLEQTTDERIRHAASDALLRLSQVLGRSLRCEEADDPGCGADVTVLPLRLVTMAEKSSLPVLTRSVAVSALLSLPISSWQAQAPRLLALAQREQVPLRTAVLAALSVLHQQANRPELLTLVSQPDDALALAASQELCWPLTLPKPNRPGATVSASVPMPVLSRVRAIAAGPLPIAVRLQAVDCLRASQLPEDRALLTQLATAAKAAKTRK